MTLELTPQEEPQAAEAAVETTQATSSIEELTRQLQQAQEAALQERRVSSKKDREIQELRARAVTQEHLKAFKNEVFEAISLALPEDEEEERPVSRRERLRKMQEVPAPPQTPLDPREADAARDAIKLMSKLGIKEGTDDYEDLVSNYAPSKAVQILEERWESEIAKRALEKERVDIARKQKESGVTKGDGVPSAAGQDDKSFIEDFNSGKLNSKADHERARKLLYS